MKVHVLLDNTSLDSRLECEHGLSIYLEYQSQKWLLDTGKSDMFIRNASVLGIDLREIDYVFISHGHSDHIGGLPAFLKLNSKAKVIISDLTFSQKYFSTNDGLHDLGIDFDVSPFEKRFIYVYDFMDLGGGVHVFPSHCEKYPMPKGNRFLFKDAGFGIQTDDFDHELAICFGIDDVLVFTGCAHNGLLNILDLVKDQIQRPVTRLFGGFHLKDTNEVEFYEKNEELDFISQIIQENYPEALLYTGHCTGPEAFQQMKTKLGDRLNAFHAGFSLEC